jgi:hypothetical protein
MNPALFTLIRLQYQGFMRRILRGTNSPRRAVFLVIGLVVITGWLLLGVIPTIAVGQRHPEQLGAAPHRFRAVAPLALLGVCVLTIVSSAGDKAIAFTPGEVDMLFPGPFSRRELLAYKLTKSTLAAFLTALLLSFALLAYSGSWLACYVGVFLTLIFVQLFSTAGVLLGQALGQRAQSLLRQGIIVVALVVGLLLARNWVASRGGMEAVYQLQDTQLGRNLLAPFEPFARAITSTSFSELAGSAGEAALIDIGLLIVVILLDANYVEAALSASRRRYAQIQRIRGGSLLSSGVKGNVTWSLPRAPWLWGAGPIAWRQATSAARSARGLLLVLLIVGIGIGPLFASLLQSVDVTQKLVATMAWLTVLLSGLLKFDFRGDIDHIEELKALPLRPAALAAGQLIVPTLILTTAHLLLLASVALAIHTHGAILLVAACLALPFNALLMAAENLIFLLFPSRPAAASPGDFQVMGRQATQLIMKSLTVMIGLGIALGIAIPIYVLLGGAMTVMTVIAGTMLIGETCALVPAIAWAFNRFDPSVDTPA